MERETAAPSCRLDMAGLRDQLERYRRISGHVDAVERQPGRLLVRFAPDLPRDRLEVALEVEGRCCPFLGIDYDPTGRRLTVTVERADQDRMLDALANALSPRVAR